MKRIDILYIVIGSLYLVVGMVLGIVMGARQDFQWVPVHAHINLVGFVAHCVFGVVHRAWPALRTTALAKVQFWLFVGGTPVFVGGVAVAMLTAHIALAIVGAILVLLGALTFLAMVSRSWLAAAHA
jgi:hypothetical protein